jgi:arsenite oxidase small subunit
VQRRVFLRMCSAGAAYAALPAQAADLRPRFYSRARLTDERGQPIRAASLAVAQNYIFHYPFVGTPCFLLNLGKPTAHDVSLKTENGATYRWPGGAGPQQSIVAYSAICTHRMSYPTRQISFISYRQQSRVSSAAHPNAIHCCSEHSEYDPRAGARVLNGPAPQPLGAILLENERASDSLYAVGTLGGDIFNAFFEKYQLRLELDYGSGRARQQIGTTTVVTELESFCKQQVRC